MWRRHMSALLNTGSCKNQISPFLESREFFNIDTRGSFLVVSILISKIIAIISNVPALVIQPQLERSAMVHFSPTRYPDLEDSRAVSKVRNSLRVSFLYLLIAYGIFSGA